MADAEIQIPAPRVIVQADRPTEIVSAPEPAIEVRRDGQAVEVLHAATQGPPGPPGGELAAPAGEVIAGHRVVRLSDGQLYLADPSNPAHAGSVAGLSLEAVTVSGAPLRFLALGPVTEPSWQFRPGPVYAGPGGVPTQTPPASGWLQIIGIALRADTLFVQPQLVIQR